MFTQVTKPGFDSREWKMHLAGAPRPLQPVEREVVISEPRIDDGYLKSTVTYFSVHPLELRCDFQRTLLLTGSSEQVAIRRKCTAIHRIHRQHVLIVELCG